MVRSRVGAAIAASLLIACGLVALAATPASATTPTVTKALGAGYLSTPGDGFVSATTTFVMPAVKRDDDD